MNGLPIKYLYYEKTGKSEVTIPRAILQANSLDWNHKDEINLIVTEIQGKRGLFLFKKEK